MICPNLPAHDPAPSLPDPATLPGFATATAWLDRHRPGLEAVLAAIQTPPPPLHEADEHDALLDDAAETARHLQAPQRPRSGELPLEVLLILTLAAAIHDSGGVRPGAPARLALIHGWGGAELAAAQHLMKAPIIAQDLFFHDPDPNADGPLHLSGPPLAETGRVLAEHYRKLTRQIEAGLMAGRGVIGLGIAPAGLSPQLSRLCALELRLPRPDRARVAALLMVLFPTARDKLRPETIPALLPDDEALARLTPLELVLAMHAPGLDAALHALRRMAVPAQAPTGPAPGLAAVAGQTEAVDAFRQLAADMAAWRDGRLAWRAISSSVILYGPPGTGKTLIAGAMAAETALPLIATSFGECQQAGHMGDMLAVLDATVADAVTRAPCIFFLDELDGFSARDTAARSNNASYTRAVITTLLRQIDRLVATEGVVLIGATNDLAAIDPAIRRPGRFDRMLRLNPPNRAGLAQILRRHLDVPDTVDDPALDRAIAEAADRLVGTSGAAAAALGRATLARARGDRLPLASALVAELDGSHPGLSRADQRRVAGHEAGHLLVGLLSGLPDPLVVRLTPTGGEVEWRAPPLYTHAMALAEIRMLLAGRAAEEVLCGQASSTAGIGHESDLARATRMAVALELEWGMGDGGLLWHGHLPHALHAPPWLRKKLDHLLSTAAAQARALIATHRATADALTDALLSEREIGGEGLARWVRRIRILAPDHKADPLVDGNDDRVVLFDPH